MIFSLFSYCSSHSFILEFLFKSSDDDARKTECRKCLQFVLRAYRMSPYG